MPSTSSLLTDVETCPRKGFYSRAWEPRRMKSSRMVTEAIRQALTATEQQDWGELAGSAVMQLAADRGLETESHKLYPSVIHHAALSDVIATSVRKPSDPPWSIPDPVQSWTSDCFLSPDGTTLRRIVLVSNWSDSRHYGECRGWRTMGEIAHYELPMDLIVVIIGQERDGLRHGPWTQGFLHPHNRTLRFRKKSRSTSEVFNDKWDKVYREDHAEISRETWLNSMLKDDVLPEVLFRVPIPVPDRRHLQRLRQMAERKLQTLYALKEVPDGNLSTCDFPVPCVFRKLCHTIPECEPAEKYGFIRLGE